MSVLQIIASQIVGHKMTWSRFCCTSAVQKAQQAWGVATSIFSNGEGEGDGSASSMRIFLRKTYTGTRASDGVFVTVNGTALNPRFDLRMFTPGEFDWGYGGSGPAQLALAILADCLQDDRQALAKYQSFKWAVVSRLHHKVWMLTEEQILREVANLDI